MINNETSDTSPVDFRFEESSESFDLPEVDLTRDYVNESINNGIPPEVKSLSDEQLAELHPSLTELPYIPSRVTDELSLLTGVDEGIKMVETTKIVGSVSSAFTSRGWGTEYSGRKGRAVSVARELINGTPESIEHVFELSQEGKGIKLVSISGPGGDLFIARDGSHRIAGCKLAELDKVPAHVENVSNVNEFTTIDPFLRDDWQDRIDAGLIEGAIESKIVGDMEVFKLNVESQVLPWMVLDQSNLVRFSQLYLKCYPNSLNGLENLKTGESIPVEALTDTVANNFYLGGRWQEYTE